MASGKKKSNHKKSKKNTLSKLKIIGGAGFESSMVNLHNTGPITVPDKCTPDANIVGSELMEGLALDHEDPIPPAMGAMELDHDLTKPTIEGPVNLPHDDLKLPQNADKEATQLEPLKVLKKQVYEIRPGPIKKNSKGFFGAFTSTLSSIAHFCTRGLIGSPASISAAKVESFKSTLLDLIQRKDPTYQYKSNSTYDLFNAFHESKIDSPKYQRIILDKLGFSESQAATFIRFNNQQNGIPQFEIDEDKHLRSIWIEYVTNVSNLRTDDSPWV